MAASNLGSSIARRGLMAPGDAVTSLGTNGQTVTSGGTSAATPFVTGAIALLWSIFPPSVVRDGCGELCSDATLAEIAEVLGDLLGRGPPLCRLRPAGSGTEPLGGFHAIIERKVG